MHDSIGERIRRSRISKSLTQDEVSKLMEVTRGAENLKGLDTTVTIGKTTYTAMEIQGLLVMMASPK